jgi:hypothetical protein
MVVLAPQTGVAFVVIAILHAPVPPDGGGKALALVRAEAG